MPSSTTQHETEAPDVSLFLLALLMLLGGAYCILSSLFKLPDILAAPLSLVLVALLTGVYQHRLTKR